MLFWGYCRMRPSPFSEVLRQEQCPAFRGMPKLVALQEPLPFGYYFLFYHKSYKYNPIILLYISLPLSISLRLASNSCC